MTLLSTPPEDHSSRRFSCLGLIGRSGGGAGALVAYIVRTKATMALLTLGAWLLGAV